MGTASSHPTPDSQPHFELDIPSCDLKLLIPTLKLNSKSSCLRLSLGFSSSSPTRIPFHPYTRRRMRDAYWHWSDDDRDEDSDGEERRRQRRRRQRRLDDLAEEIEVEEMGNWRYSGGNYVAPPGYVYYDPSDGKVMAGQPDMHVNMRYRGPPLGVGGMGSGLSPDMHAQQQTFQQLQMQQQMAQQHQLQQQQMQLHQQMAQQQQTPLTSLYENPRTPPLPPHNRRRKRHPPSLPTTAFSDSDMAEIAEGIYAIPEHHPRRNHSCSAAARLNRNQPPARHVGASGHEWIAGNPFLDVFTCTTQCACRKGARVLYRSRANDDRTKAGEIRYVLKEYLGRDCGDWRGGRGTGDGGSERGSGSERGWGRKGRKQKEKGKEENREEEEARRRKMIREELDAALESTFSKLNLAKAMGAGAGQTVPRGATANTRDINPTGPAYTGADPRMASLRGNGEAYRMAGYPDGTNGAGYYDYSPYDIVDPAIDMQPHLRSMRDIYYGPHRRDRDGQAYLKTRPATDPRWEYDYRRQMCSPPGYQRRRRDGCTAPRYDRSLDIECVKSDGPQFFADRAPDRYTERNDDALNKPRKTGRDHDPEMPQSPERKTRRNETFTTHASRQEGIGRNRQADVSEDDKVV